ncbi:uncharacterized protein Z519_03252 [Cladophialophora bantiana CBS 173.52]|uniref:Amino acid permease/ SLC12A domain-containing protein n=1 Tax=Cladophialophora bantiana (strain ATCC 10958 / CBS 173.52 / CDC B-1940 / NIH 8579) TaxID=1442370 RepID=A0A0D2HZ46_CLAB1|nr:uncharacterized protein Z519_03252 [Cladophialophora bantiana CBS 173.52]KIW96185.1 hypothetical protein Z519_03252 [Cladophialophora bantiana CBS 173.52]
MSESREAIMQRIEEMEVEDGAERPRFTEEEMEKIRQARVQPRTVVTTRPTSLGYLSIACIIINRMVGTGIFRTPTTVAHGTHSVGYSLVFWAAGAIVAVSGVLVFAEFGMTVPRLPVENEHQKESVPRNGGEKNYLEYMVKRPLYLATCIYGIPFIFLGTAAGNAIVFAENIMQAAGKEAMNASVRGIAVSVITFACLLHAISRTGGVWLNNFFGAVKFVMLLVLFILGVVYAAGGFGGSDETAAKNLNVHKSFAGAATSSYGYAEAFLAIIFAIGGFNQANYVLGDIDDPRKKFKHTAVTTVSIVSILYILINISYMLVVPTSVLFEHADDTVARPFFQRIFGEKAADKVLCGFIAFSSFGNIIVQTFTAARVKQEIAKEGILPWAKFFANNYSLWPRRLRRDTRAETSDDTPAGALILHLVFAVALILLTVPEQNPNDAYRTMVSLYSFTIDALFGFAVGLSLLILRLRPGYHWASKSDSNAYVSISAALIFTIANAFPLVAVWIPPSGDTGITQPVKWYLTGTIGMGLIGFSLMYWVVFSYVVPRLKGKKLEVEREEILDDRNGYWIMWHEIVRFNWRVV